MARMKKKKVIARLKELGYEIMTDDYMELCRILSNAELIVPGTDVNHFTKPDDTEHNPMGAETELEAANKEAAEAQLAADEAVKVAEDKAKVAESKKPAPCWRCNGDGEWHSTKTGVRAKTSSEPLHDASRVCPECN
jgi:hypothetical protein